MEARTTALLLIGFQNDFFSEDGVLHESLAESAKAQRTLSNTVKLIKGLANSDVAILSSPIVFSPDYKELEDPIGVLKVIRDTGAFIAGQPGSETVPEFAPFAAQIQEVPGRQSFNSFSNTQLLPILKSRGIRDLLVSGVITSACIDSTARTAFEEGFRVTVLSDCTAGRDSTEQDFFCQSVFPTFSLVATADDALANLSGQAAEA